MYFRSVLHHSEGLYHYILDLMFKGFCKTNYEKVKRGVKIYFCCRTKCYFAQCLPLNLTVVVVPLTEGITPLYMLGFLQ